MRYIDIVANFEREINKFDDIVDKPSTDDSLFWLNQGVAKFYKLRFNSDPVHETSYEQNEKRRTDLIKLYKTVDYSNDFSSEHHMVKTTTEPSYDSYKVAYPEDFQFSLNEDVIISDTNGDHEMNTCMFECTSDSFMYRVNNSLTDFHYRYHRARPLRVRTSDGCLLLTDKKYNICKYTLGYLRKPKEITLQNPFDEYGDFEDIIMPEIIKMAAQMYLENKKDERYRTYSQEVNTQE